MEVGVGVELVPVFDAVFELVEEGDDVEVDAVDAPLEVELEAVLEPGADELEEELEDEEEVVTVVVGWQV